MKLILCTIIAIACGLIPAVALAGEPTLRISAAISLKDALEEIITVYETETGGTIELNLGASGQLMEQVRQGAPVDVFISAADKQVDDLIHSGLADASTRRVVVGNSLVLIVSNDQNQPVTSFAGLKLARIKRVAIGQPRTVPAGDYAMQVLQALKLEGALKDRLVFGANVRQVLDYVSRGEVDAGIVYRTDALQAGDDVRIVATAEESTHRPIEYPAVMIKGTAHGIEAEKFLSFLAGAKSHKILLKHGFELPHLPAASTPATRSSTPANAP